MKRTVTQVNHLEVLHRVCRRKGWRMGLRLDGEPGELVSLDVIDRDRELVGRWPLSGETTQQAAVALLDGMQRGGLVP